MAHFARYRGAAMILTAFTFRCPPPPRTGRSRRTIQVTRLVAGGSTYFGIAPAQLGRAQSKCGRHAAEAVARRFAQRRRKRSRASDAIGHYARRA